LDFRVIIKKINQRHCIFVIDTSDLTGSKLRLLFPDSNSIGSRYIQYNGISTYAVVNKQYMYVSNDALELFEEIYMDQLLGPSFFDENDPNMHVSVDDFHLPIDSEAY
jgi:hypothetical protein